MVTLLVIGADTAAPAHSAARVEILRAHDLEEGLETLARNRRIDAILILHGQAPSPIISAIREENAAPPPIFVACGPRPAPAGSRGVSADPTAAIEEICGELE
ncbi:MAG TPA: hypothetical protein VJA66_01810 [Thermoanaerobaculia bacterium]